MRELRVGEHAVRHQPVARAARSAGQIISNDAKVIAGRMRELRAAGAVAHGPDVGRGGLQSVVDANVSAGVQLDAGLLEPDPVRVWNAPCRNQNITAFDVLLAGRCADGNADVLS